MLGVVSVWSQVSAAQRQGVTPSSLQPPSVGDSRPYLSVVGAPPLSFNGCCPELPRQAEVQAPPTRAGAHLHVAGHDPALDILLAPAPGPASTQSVKSRSSLPLAPAPSGSGHLPPSSAAYSEE